LFSSDGGAPTPGSATGPEEKMAGEVLSITARRIGALARFFLYPAAKR